MRKVALLFPGQGAQYMGMGKKFYERYDIVKNLFEEASDELNIDLKKLCFQEDMKTLTQTKNSQIVVYLVSVAMFKVFMEENNIMPCYVAGHSLGELSALTCSGAMKISDGFKIVKARGNLMQRANKLNLGTMKAIKGIDYKEIEAIINKNSNSSVNISCYNSLNECVISGKQKDIEVIENDILKKNCKIIELKVSAPFHNPMMKFICDEFKEELDQYKYNDFSIPVVSSVDGALYKNKDEIVDKLIKQITNPVLWIDVMEFLKDNLIDTVVEIGPQKVLKNLAINNYHQFKCYAYDKDEDILLLEKQKMESQLSLLKKSITICLSTKNNEYNEVLYKQNIVEPIKYLKNFYREIENDKRWLKAEEETRVIMLVSKILEAKKVPKYEKQERLEELLLHVRNKNIRGNLSELCGGQIIC